MKKLTFFILLLIASNGLFAQTQTIRGQLLDQQSKYPLVGVNVYLPDTDPVMATTTDAEGYYEIKNVPLGRYTIKCSMMGYKEQNIPNLVLSAGKELVLNISLEEQIFQTEEVVVTAEQEKGVNNNELATVSSRGFSVDETARYAGSRNDPSRMAQNFAGVSGGNDSRNDIIIRGNSPLGLLWRLEGIDIPNPSHFSALGTTGGPVSMLNNNVLANSDFMTSAFPAEYGNATSGVFDLQMRTGNKSKREYMFQIGFNGFEAGLEGYFSKKSKATYLVNYRYSTLAVFSQIGFNFGTGTAVPYYQDISFKFDFPTKKAGRFTLWGLGGASNIDLLGSKNKPDPNDLFTQNNDDIRQRTQTGVVGIKHLFFFSEKTYIETSIATSLAQEIITADSIVRDASLEVQEIRRRFGADYNQGRSTFKTQINSKLNARNTINFGVIADWMQLNLLDSAFSKNNLAFRNELNSQDGNLLVRTYAQWQHRFNDKLILNAGVYFQQFLYNNTNSVEPRLGLKYNFSPRQSLSIGFGMHSQLQPLQVYFRERRMADGTYVRTNKDLDFTRSNHFVVGYDNRLGENLRIKVEAYYQQITNVPVENANSTFSMLNAGTSFGIDSKDYLVNNGTGTNYGLEFTLEKFYSKNYYFLVTASLFDSKYKGGDGIERNTSFNGNYVANALFGKEWKFGKNNAFYFDTKVTYAGGRRFTEVNLASSQATGTEVLNENKAFESRLDDYFRWDLKVGVRFNSKKGLTQEFFVDVQNVTNRQNIFSQTYDDSIKAIRPTYQLGLFPVVQYRITF